MLNRVPIVAAAAVSVVFSSRPMKTSGINRSFHQVVMLKIITVMIFNITTWWNDLLIPLVFIGREEKTTLTAAAATIGTRFNMDYPLVLTALFVASLPPIVAYIILQRYIRRGLVLGAVK